MSNEHEKWDAPPAAPSIATSGSMEWLQAELKKHEDYGAACEETIQRLQDEAAEQCRLNGKGSEREAALLGEVFQLRREIYLLEQDRKRLDWLASNSEVEPDGCFSVRHLIESGYHITRAAIDAAMSAEGGK